MGSIAVLEKDQIIHPVVMPNHELLLLSAALQKGKWEGKRGEKGRRGGRRRRSRRRRRRGSGRGEPRTNRRITTCRENHREERGLSFFHDDFVHSSAMRRGVDLRGISQTQRCLANKVRLLKPTHFSFQQYHSIPEKMELSLFGRSPLDLGFSLPPNPAQREPSPSPHERPHVRRSSRGGRDTSSAVWWRKGYLMEM